MGPKIWKNGWNTLDIYNINKADSEGLSIYALATEHLFPLTVSV